MATGTSKKVKCPECGKEVFARGLPGHLRIQHKLVVSKLIIPLHSSSASQIKGGGHLSRTTQVVEEITTYEKVNVVGAGSRVVPYSYEYWVKYWDSHIDEAAREWPEIKRILKNVGNVMYASFPQAKWKALIRLREPDYEKEITWT